VSINSIIIRECDRPMIATTGIVSFTCIIWKGCG